MSLLRRRLRTRTRVERLADRGDVRRLIRLLGKHDWLVDRDGRACDLAVGRRIEAVAALGSIESAEAEDGVVLALDDGDPRVRRAAVNTFRREISAKAAKALAQTAAKWRDPSLAEAQAAALEILIAMDDEVLAVVFAEALVDDAERVQLTAEDERALRRLFSVEKGRATEILADRLTVRLSALDNRERRLAHQVLVMLGSAAVRPLVDALAEPGRRQAACAALGAIRDTRAVPALLAMLDRGDAASRAMAARTLGAIRDPRSLEALVRAGNDADANVRDAALDALDRLGAVVEVLGAAALAGSTDRRLGKIDGEPERASPDGVELRRVRGLAHRTLLQRLLGKQSH